MANLLKIPEACEALSVNVKTLREMISRGTVKAVRLGPKTTRVTRESIEALISEPTVFDRARSAVYAELNEAFEADDLERARNANEVNRLLSRARDDSTAGRRTLAIANMDQAMARLPACPPLIDYRWSL